MAISKKERQLVFEKYGGRCAYCGCELQKGWHVDHIEPIRRNFVYNRKMSRFDNVGTCEHPENETIDNYNPSCASCNINKHSMTLEQFRKSIKAFIKHLNEINTQYKIAKRYGLVQETDIEVVFYFEKINTTNEKI